jgi:hypothetical protein
MVLAVVSQQAEVDAIKAALNTALPAGQSQAYEYDETPATASYVRLDLSRRFIPDRLGSGEATVVCGRLVTRYVGESVANVRELRRLVTATLEDKAIPAGSSYVGPFTFEVEQPISPQSGTFSGADTWKF